MLEVTMRSTLALLPCLFLALGCDAIDDAIHASNAVDLEAAAGAGVVVSNIRLKPQSVTSALNKSERNQLELSLSVKVTAAQPPDAHVAARLACEVGDKTMGAPGISFVHLRDQAAGSQLDRDIRLDVGRGVETNFKTCELELAYVQRSNNLAESPRSTISLGKVCYRDDELSVGPCEGSALSRKVEREKPTVAGLEATMDSNPPPGQGGLTPAPGKPRPTHRVRFTYLLQRGSKPFPADGHSVDARCRTAAGVEMRHIGYPSQGNGVAPGEWQAMENGSWYFMSEPRACELTFSLGGGSLTPARGRRSGSSPATV